MKHSWRATGLTDAQIEEFGDVNQTTNPTLLDTF
eukprot:CAMPEP_0198701548 /NCGR_PEP_ID=MMETSP1468-20131203/386891_1 /TAXON_ID=1461545 /ORGANISM="Mantoniella sp, Strain CCMP1436" /LENGTH=33 /DNA_ID= /DNA_START= /DNA_END= /DNA_ORIENTATION=